MNPYSAVGGSVQTAGSGASASGRLKAGKLSLAQAAQAVPERFLSDVLLKDTSKKIGVDWRNLNFFGPNNELLQELTYLVDIVNTNIVRLVIAQGDASRFSIP
jgi:hypothetical protein